MHFYIMRLPTSMYRLVCWHVFMPRQKAVQSFLSWPVFDMVHQDILIIKLKIMRTKINIVNLITSSFFNHKQQAISFNSCLNKVTQLNIGVPQGSILGPLLFAIYTNYLPLHLNITRDLLADNFTIYTSQENCDAVERALQKRHHTS